MEPKPDPSIKWIELVSDTDINGPTGPGPYDPMICIPDQYISVSPVKNA